MTKLSSQTKLIKLMSQKMTISNLEWSSEKNNNPIVKILILIQNAEERETSMYQSNDRKDSSRLNVILTSCQLVEYRQPASLAAVKSS